MFRLKMVHNLSRYAQGSASTRSERVISPIMYLIKDQNRFGGLRTDRLEKCIMSRSGSIWHARDQPSNLKSVWHKMAWSILRCKRLSIIKMRGSNLSYHVSNKWHTIWCNKIGLVGYVDRIEKCILSMSGSVRCTREQQSNLMFRLKMVHNLSRYAQGSASTR